MLLQAPEIEVVESFDPRELDGASRLSGRVPADMRVHRYQLLDRGLLRAGPFAAPITRISTLRMQGAYLCLIEDRFATQIDIGGDGLDRYCLSVPLSGAMRLERPGTAVAAGGSQGLALRGAAGTRLLTSDGTSRLNLWIEARGLVEALEEMLCGRLRTPLEFRPDVDWGSGLASVVRAQIGFLSDQMTCSAGQREGIVAAPSFTRMIVSSVLHGLPHSYTERIGQAPSAAVPRYVRRAEAFMHAHATDAIRIADVAAAAACSVRALSQSFRRFRETTPLSALHAIRLDLARAALQRRESVGDVARAHRFASPGRFRVAYRRRFGELPSETARGWGRIGHEGADRAR